MRIGENWLKMCFNYFKSVKTTSAPDAAGELAENTQTLISERKRNEMELGLLRELFKGGILKRASIHPAQQNGPAWTVKIEKNNGELETITLSMSGRTGETKFYRRLTAALMDIGRIGFAEVVVLLPEKLYEAPSVGAAGLK